MQTHEIPKLVSPPERVVVDVHPPPISNESKRFSRAIAWFVICCILIAVVIAVFITLLVLKPRTTFIYPDTQLYTGIGYNARGLQQSFKNSADGSFLVADNRKPFAIEITKDGPIEQGFVFPTLFNGMSPQTINRCCHAFTFQVRVPVAVVSLQVVDRLFAAGKRSVGIFEFGSRQLLIAGDVSKTDMLLHGYRTRFVDVNHQVILLPNTVYVSVGLVHRNDDLVFGPQKLTYENQMLIVSGESPNIAGGQGVVTSDVLIMPSQYQFSEAMDHVNNVNFLTGIPFTGFRLQRKLVPNTRIWSVDTQYAQFPPGYIYDMNVKVVNSATWDTISISSGFACASNCQANLILPLPLVVKLPFLPADTWCAVYVAVPDESIDGNNASIYASPNYLSSDAGSRSRRIGWVRFNVGDRGDYFLWRMTQTGDGVRRTTRYDEPAKETMSVLSDKETSNFALTLVPPTASEVTLRVTAQTRDNVLPQAPFSLYINGITTSIEFFEQQDSQVQTISVPLSDDFSFPTNVRIEANIPDASLYVAFTFEIVQFTEDI